MFRLLKYALIFFLGYYIIKKLFGKPSVEKKQPEQPPVIKEEGPSEPSLKFDKSSGEYIDYEEIK